MENIKKIAIFVGVAGFIAVGYYLLKKTKPKIADEQLEKLNTDEETLIEKDLFIPTPTSPRDSTTPVGSGRRDDIPTTNTNINEELFNPNSTTTTTPSRSNLPTRGTTTNTTTTTPTRSSTRSTTTTTPTRSTTTRSVIR
jgi:hypothetical protein